MELPCVLLTAPIMLTLYADTEPVPDGVMPNVTD
jgi:hypothetical protein